MTSTAPPIVGLVQTSHNTRRGGDVRVLLGPATVASTSGFMGIVILEPGEAVAEHYHPYSEEFLCIIEGSLEIDLDGQTRRLNVDDAVLVPLDIRHRLRNPFGTRARAVFHCGPLAPRPELGHVDTETREQAAATMAARAPVTTS